MGRTIITHRDIAQIPASREGSPAKAEPTADDFNSRVMKYIPAEVVAVYVFVDAIIKQSADLESMSVLMWITFIAIFVMTPLYLWKVQKVAKWVQIVICTVAFAVWVFSLGGPFAALSWYEPIYGAVLLPLFTFAAGIVEPHGGPTEGERT
jgi:hypothetical protein